MNWIHSSKVIALGVLLTMAFAAVGTAAALEVVGDEPAPTEVGETVTHEVTIEEPFRDQPEQWDLQGQTDLEGASWTVNVESQGDSLTTEEYSGQSFTLTLDDQTATEVQIEVNGQVPGGIDFNYRDRSAENYTAIELSRGDTELATFTGHRYTTGDGDDEAGSLEARQAIDEAIEATSEDNDDVQTAITLYENGEFSDAIERAETAQSGAQTTQLLMIAGGVVVVLVLVGGGIYYWREQQKKDTKLQ